MLPDRKLNRLPNFNYSSLNSYFVTSCIQTREHWFGEIMDDQMYLNEYGLIANEQFKWLQNQYPYLQIHAHIVMPNHIHAIIEIFSMEPVGTGRDLSARIPDQPFPANHSEQGIPGQILPTQPLQSNVADQNLPTQKIKSLSEIMGAYKTTTTKRIRQAGLPEFAWQRSFHDHIIRDERGFQNIYLYILNNPAQWKQDKFFTP